MELKVICLEEQAFYKLIEEIKDFIRQERREEWKWINDKEAMRLLNIKSKTTLQNLRDEGKIRFSQHLKKNILYDKNSINEYIERNVKEVF